MQLICGLIIISLAIISGVIAYVSQEVPLIAFLTWIGTVIVSRIHIIRMNERR